MPFNLAVLYNFDNLNVLRPNSGGITPSGFNHRPQKLIQYLTQVVFSKATEKIKYLSGFF